MNLKVIYISIAVVLILLLLTQVEVESSIDVLGRLYPRKVWTLSKGADGEIIASLQDYATGLIQSYDVAHIIRGDVAKFQLNSIGNFIKAGDTVGFFYSNEVEYQLARLRGLLDIERATLKFYMTGEKEALVKQAQKKLEQAKEQAEAQRKIYERAKALYEKSLISAQEYEIAYTTLKLYETNVDIAKAELESIITGAKEEQIKLIEANIKAIQEQIKVLEKRIKDYTIISPISGVVFGYFSQDTILAISDISEVIILLPIKLSYVSKIRPGQSVMIKNYKNLSASVKAFQERTEVLNGEQVIFCVAVLKDKITDLKPGAFVNCSVRLERVRLIEFITRFITNLFPKL